jgi:hypothetical protein
MNDSAKSTGRQGLESRTVRETMLQGFAEEARRGGHVGNLVDEQAINFLVGHLRDRSSCGEQQRANGGLAARIPSDAASGTDRED